MKFTLHWCREMVQYHKYKIIEYSERMLAYNLVEEFCFQQKLEKPLKQPNIIKKP